QFAPKNDVEALLKKAQAKFGLNSNHDAPASFDAVAYTAYLQNGMADIIADHGGPGYTFWTIGHILLILVLLGLAGGAYVRFTNYPLPEFARGWRPTQNR